MSTSRKQSAALVTANKVADIAKRVVAALAQGNAHVQAVKADAQRQFDAALAKGRHDKLAMLATAAEGMEAYVSKDAFNASMGAALAKLAEANAETAGTLKTARSELCPVLMALAHGLPIDGRSYQDFVGEARWFLAHRGVDGFAFTKDHIAAGLDTAESYTKPERKARDGSQGPGTATDQDRAIKRAFNVCGVESPSNAAVTAIGAIMTNPGKLQAFLNWYGQEAAKKPARAAGEAQPVKAKPAPAQPDMSAIIAQAVAAAMAAAQA